MDKENAVKSLKSYLNFLIENKINVKEAYLFGSYANGSYTDDSDMDLAIVIGGIKNRFEMQVKLMIMRRKNESIIEPHPFSEEDFNSYYPFAEEIKRTGIRIL
ncbi:MAG: hypothetical protein A2W91_11035 [Bacteroidetes bacterium GWF2_38_335]|nr:MAG: hypothetical protein A2W91_11035 [Bacteroidetes bacterium GWF2_38_335]OFY81920.1 MAG: hypothetical protein A2281_06005 [Bacteroidetes bacterium RIFOXYA12_FULL_38_20]HBS87834.1 nucleotidyltransferase [Bacteroidales bacterium]